KHIQRGFHQERVRVTLEDLTLHLDTLHNLFDQLKREPEVRILAMEPDHSSAVDDQWMTIDGENFQPGMSAYLIEWDDEDKTSSTSSDEGKKRIIGRVLNVVSTTEMKVVFDLGSAESGKYKLVVRSPDPESVEMTY